MFSSDDQSIDDEEEQSAISCMECGGSQPPVIECSECLQGFHLPGRLLVPLEWFDFPAAIFPA